MTKHDDFESWSREFKAFAEGAESAPPLALSSRMLQRVREDLNPSPSRVSGRLFAIHALAGSATLTLCPQFGIGPLGGGDGLMGFFMQYGHAACGAFCGFFFVALTALVSLFALRPEEIRVAARTRLWQFSALAVFSMTGLMLIGGAVRGEVANAHPEFLVPWLLSAVFGAVLLFTLGTRARGLSPAR